MNRLLITLNIFSTLLPWVLPTNNMQMNNGVAIQPDFAEPIQNITVPVGRDAIFKCLVTNLGGYRDLKQFLDDSKKGAIYFSLGSNVKSTNLPGDKRAAILNAFRQLPYNILWKWENDTLHDKLGNVLAKTWFPQQDVLDHPNLKAFITQGGMQSTEEAIRSTVPLICVPFGVDQRFNARRIVDLGIGRHLPFDDITTDTLMDAINDVAADPKYKKSIAKLASVLWDQPTKPLDRAVWWVEYVIRHGGARHLRSPVADFPWHKYLMLDILGFILTVGIIGIIAIIKVIKLLFRIIPLRKIKHKEQ